MFQRVRRVVLAGLLIMFGTYVVRDVRMGGGPAVLASLVDAAPRGCEAFRGHAARRLLGGRAIGIGRETPEAECAWRVPGSRTGAVLSVRTSSRLGAGFSGRPLQAVLRSTRPQPSPGHLVADLDVNGRPGWSRVVLVAPGEAATTTTWIADGKLYSLAVRRRLSGDLEHELSDISTAIIAIDRRVRR